MKALAVDDDPLFLVMLSKTLARFDVACATASSATEALEKLENDSFDLLITDIVMPKKSGTELVRQTREKHPDIKIAIMTGGLSTIHPADQMADFILLKPFTRDDIQHILIACREASAAKG